MDARLRRENVPVLCNVEFSNVSPIHPDPLAEAQPVRKLVRVAPPRLWRIGAPANHAQPGEKSVDFGAPSHLRVQNERSLVRREEHMHTDVRRLPADLVGRRSPESFRAYTLKSIISFGSQTVVCRNRRLV